MRRVGWAVVFAISAVSFATAVSHEPVTLSAVQERAKIDAETPEGRVYLRQFFTNSWRLALDAANEHCRPAAVGEGTPTEFILALVISERGYPTTALVTPDDDWLKCMADRLRATKFIEPPRDGFAIYIPFRATEPGTEHRGISPASFPATDR